MTRALFAWLLCTVVGCAAVGSSDPVTAKCRRDDADVITAVLEHQFSENALADVILVEETIGRVAAEPSWVRNSALADEELASGLSDLRARNRASSAIPLKRGQSLARVIAHAEVRDVFSEGGEQSWERFRKVYGAGAVLTAVSLPGYHDSDASPSVAVVLLSVGTGPHSSELTLEFLRCEMGQWRIVGRAVVAVA